MISWGNLIVLGLIILGHTTIWIALINRLHAIPWHDRKLRRLRHLHDVMLLAFPVVLLWFVGWNGPQLLRGGRWQSIGWGWGMICGICALGDLWLLGIILKRLFRTPPTALIALSATVYDIEQELGYRPVVRGKYYALSRVPGNQQFQLEVTERHLSFARLPATWEGLSLLHLSDFHLLGTITRDYYRKVMDHARELPADLVCFTGDLIDNMARLDWLPELFAEIQAPLGRYFILGNHDWYQEPDVIREALRQHGWTNVGSRCEVISHRQHLLGIAGDETPWLGTHPPFDSNLDFRLLLSHTPDHFAWARRQQVDLMLSGHNHGGQVQIPPVGPIYAPSRYGCTYADGDFEAPPTLLSVSRGLAGQHPLRINCRPEISRIVLHFGEPASRFDAHIG